MKFRKKPVIIEAIQFDGTIDSMSSIMNYFLNIRINPHRGSEPFSMTIETLEGQHICSPMDWVIKGVKGEYYPCKPDIFFMTYESAENPKS